MTGGNEVKENEATMRDVIEWLSDAIVAEGECDALEYTDSVTVTLETAAKVLDALRAGQAYADAWEAFARDMQSRAKGIAVENAEVALLEAHGVDITSIPLGSAGVLAAFPGEETTG